jgi:hypothetical protein
MKKTTLLIALFFVLTTCLLITIIANKTHIKADSNNCLALIPEVNLSMDGTVLEKRLDGADDPKNFILYKKTDGELLGILYPVDVKYIDIEGNLRDKSNKIYDSKSSDFKYETVYNDILSFFPEDIKKGVTTTYDDYKLTITPEFIKNAVAELKDNKVIYNEIGRDISIEYEATFNGVKDVVVLNEPGTDYIFEYKINAYGLTIDGEGTITSGNSVVGNIGSVLIEDSRGLNTTGTIKCSETERPSEYVLSVILPTVFMDDPETTYPVSIDPVLFLFGGSDYYNNSFYSASTLYFSNCSSGGTLTQNSTLSVGKYNQTSFRRTVIKFPGLNDIFEELAPHCSSITLDLCRYQAYTGGSGIYLEAYPEMYEWTQGVAYTATQYSNIYSQYYNNQYYYNGNTYYSNGKTLLYNGATANGFTSIPIRDVLRYTNYSQNKGILLKLSTETASITFYGANTANASHMPRITLSYTDDEAEGIISGGIYRLSSCTAGPNTVSDFSLTSSNGVSMSLTNESVSEVLNYPVSIYNYKSYMQNPSQLFKLTYTGYGYTIQRISDNYYLKCANATTLQFVANDDTIDYTTRWFIIKTGEKYLITHYFFNHLSVIENDNHTAQYVTMQSYTSGTGVLWNLSLYCLGIPYHEQESGNTCGAAASVMLLNWLGIDTSGYGESGIYASAGALLGPGEGPNPETDQYQRVIYGLLGFVQYYYGVGEGHEISNYSYRYWIYEGGPTVSNTPEDLFNIIEANIDIGKPLIIDILIDNNHYPASSFVYKAAEGHYLLIAGAYRDAQGDGRIVVFDPHYNASSELEPTPNGYGQSPAVLDLPVSDLFEVWHYSILIRTVTYQS